MTASGLAVEDCVDTLSRLWVEVLQVPAAGTGDDFFALGGDSIAATRLMARLRAELRVDLPVTAVFGTPVLGELARLVAVADTLAPPAPAPPAGGLTPAQRRQWFLEQFSRGSSSYNIPLILRIHGPADTAALRAAVRDLVSRHRILRTRYPDDDGEPRSVTEVADGFRVGMVRVAPERLDSWVRGEVRRPFDLAAGPVFRATLCRAGSAAHVLAMTVHHIAADGWSRRILLDDLARLYAFHRGLGPLPAAEPVQYADLGVRPDGEEGVAWWIRELRGAPDRTTFPSDRDRPDTLTDVGETIPFELGNRLSAAIRALAKTGHTTTYTVLMAALHALLSRETGETDTVIATSVAGREDSAAETVIGCFINTVAVRVDHSGDPTVADLLRRVWAATVGALEHSGVSFERVVQGLGARRDPAYRPVFQVMLTVHNEPAPDPSLPGLDVTWLEADNGGAKCDTFFAVTDDGGPLRGFLTYRTQLYERPSAQRLIDSFIATLSEMAAEPARRIAELGLQ